MDEIRQPALYNMLGIEIGGTRFSDEHFFQLRGKTALHHIPRIEVGVVGTIPKPLRS